MKSGFRVLSFFGWCFLLVCVFVCCARTGLPTAEPIWSNGFPQSSVTAPRFSEEQSPQSTNMTYIRTRGKLRPSLLELEWLGHVPDGAGERTWRLCESTSWWGRRLDPAAFWSNRVVWLDFSARAEANAHGRLYPPIPMGDNRFLNRSDKDRSSVLVTWESRGRAYYSSEREHVYWDWFQKNMPQPPETIDWALERAGSEWASIKNRSSVSPPGMTIPPPSKEEQRVGMAAHYTCLGFPKEAFSDTVLDWEFVRCKRKELRQLLQSSGRTGSEMLLDHFKRTLGCSFELVDNPPSDEEVRVTTGWRIEYLRRLRREGKDESYIKAYKKAWGITEEQLRVEE